ncbi:hypothetical protein O3597_24310 [Verrucosispora sp. WMMA2044]|uniref:Uncharacterized protein n=2 Tax=Verrucosispora sioxanthis TaxID=2499994 RepID=A0A6M1L5N9_9ACTN|nr:MULTISPECIES: hypothetical protein [Micromonospora]NEE63714.1 hypothetical protein [Verrucosispora sioxanthis]NGM12824.1 hypothetical protein [Verrucosispora sioxanthis]WBB48196.1 hypothetical protein O3597_24310 [Verrucosispora sp. WMMA2044]
MTAAVMVLGATGCGPAPGQSDGPTGGTRQDGDTPYLSDALLTAPLEPPALSLVAGARREPLRRIMVDWSARGGPVTGPPRHVDWPAARLTGTTRRVTMEFGTAQLPSRVVLYRYPGTGADGIPDEDAGTETICGYSTPAASCSRTGGGDRPAQVDVALDVEAGGYWVVHAAWPVLVGRSSTEQVPVVSASWVVRVDQMEGRHADQRDEVAVPGDP